MPILTCRFDFDDSFSVFCPGFPYFCEMITGKQYFTQKLFALPLSKKLLI
ncbi:MAG: hypothetical protein JG782_252 [Anaerophaga sp.]|nr:hypothetical protein [Anaerophaga sp.]MDK2841601.1 hypothetical protein [Anaerophaga sp.]MDN5292226.1 hypothetical protein [Anaerophaga sp.]